MTFSGSEVAAICSCPINVYLVGDLKFFVQMSGRDGMSSYWCMWCLLRPTEWRTFAENKDAVPEKGNNVGH